MNCFTIGAQTSFLGQLSGWLLEKYGQDPESLPRALVLLPNRRACLALREAFLKASGGKPLLLPRMQPIGEAGDEIPTLSEGIDISPPISPNRRHLLLTRWVMDFEKRRHGRIFDVAQSAQLARQLMRFMDDMAREDADFKKLETLVPEELAQHWQETLSFLEIVSHQWPKVLAEEGVIEPVVHRNLLLKGLAKAWRNNPPDYPIIAAGSTGSQPATAELLSVIARLPQGCVILPALDTDMPDEEWKQVGETHPQFGLKQLLKRLGCKRGDVSALSHRERGGASQGEGGTAEDALTPALSRRERVLRAILQPAPATTHWRETKLSPQGLAGLRFIEADTPLEEARMIAIALREVLETPGKTAALVTPDRTMARMAAAALRRFGIAIDDSAGRLLNNTPPGCYLRLALEMSASQAAPVALLALLRHPLAGAGLATAECRRLSRQLEIDLLRGVRTMPGIDALRNAANDPALKKFLSAIESAAKPLAELLRRKSAPLKSLLEAHLAFAENLAVTDEFSGGERLWAGEAGRSLAAHIADLLAETPLLPQVDPVSYPALFEALLAEASYWPSYGQHPRLHILSPIEARLQHFDMIILGGLNEGVWPALAEPDPWMSRPMRGQMGLASPEEAIGRSAHDFSGFASAPKVLLSRARKSEGVATIASRWWVRAKTLLGDERFSALSATDYYARAIAALDAKEPLPPISKPAPKPPVLARPRRLRVTSVDTWLRDPYMIYAAYILKLKVLKPLDQEPSHADFGMMVHGALERFVKAFPAALPDDAYAQLLACGKDAFAEYLDRPAIAALWWPRFESIAAWLVKTDAARRPLLSKLLAEIKSEWNFSVDGKPFSLTTRIDRLEIGKDGRGVIVDYKTGTLPTKADIARGLANQLPLEALIAQHGLPPSLALPPIGGGEIKMEYWRLSANAAQCEIAQLPLEEIQKSHERLLELIRRFDDPATAYAPPNDPSQLPRYNDYEHFTRRQEWETI